MDQLLDAEASGDKVYRGEREGREREHTIGASLSELHTSKSLTMVAYARSCAVWPLAENISSLSLQVHIIGHIPPAQFITDFSWAYHKIVTR